MSLTPGKSSILTHLQRTLDGPFLNAGAVDVKKQQRQTK